MEVMTEEETNKKPARKEQDEPNINFTVNVVIHAGVLLPRISGLYPLIKSSFKIIIRS